MMPNRLTLSRCLGCSVMLEHLHDDEPVPEGQIGVWLMVCTSTCMPIVDHAVTAIRAGGAQMMAVVLGRALGTLCANKPLVELGAAALHSAYLAELGTAAAELVAAVQPDPAVARSN